MSKKPDRDWKPSRAIKHWAHRYAERQYHRKGSRLVKIDSKEESELQSDLEALDQASSLSISVENLIPLSAPVSRTQSLERVTFIGNKEISKSEENLRQRHSSEGYSSSSKKVTRPLTKIKVKSGANMEELEEALSKMSASIEGAIGGTYKNNYKTLPPLPYFSGETPKNQTKEPWTLYNCQDFLRMIENAVNNDSWTDPGKLRTLQDKLIGVARMYWEDRDDDVNTFDSAKVYLMERFPNTESFPTINRQIMEFKRKPGESIPAMACRIQSLYNKLSNVAPEVKSAQQRNMKELFLNNLPEIVRDQVSDTDPYNKVIEISLSYLERHKELKLRTTDIQLETTFRADAKMNNVNASNKDKEKGNAKNNNKKDNQNVPNGTQKRSNNNSINNGTANVNNLNYDNNTSQRGFRGNTRGGFRGRINTRGNSRGLYRGNFNFRGQGNSFRGYQGNFRSRGMRRENRGHYRGNSSGFRDQSSNNFSSAELKCFSCGREGHFSNTCPNRRPYQNVRGSSGSNYSRSSNLNPCWTCGRTTHFTRDCPQKN